MEDVVPSPTAEVGAAPLVPTSDPHDAGPPARNAVERWFARRLRDERDLKFVRVSLLLNLTVVPISLSFFFWDYPWWLPLLWVPVLFAKAVGRYSLMLHAVSHRPVFSRNHRWLEYWVPWLLGPFFGHTPTSFYVHHMGMHHPENNLFTDQSTTLPYQRDRFTHFLHYWVRFFFFGYTHLLRYLRLRKRKKLLRTFYRGETAYVLTMVALLALNWRGALVAFILPLLVLRVLMMTGNWAQHAFVDVDDPNNCYRNSTNLINVRYNHNCYNDGYHIVHHIKPAMHWTEMPGWYEDNIEQFGAEDAVVFDGLGNNQVVWWCLMRQDWDRLARHLVDLPGQATRSHEEKIAWLQDRVRRKGSPWRGLTELEPAKRKAPAAA